MRLGSALCFHDRVVHFSAMHSKIITDGASALEVLGADRDNLKGPIGMIVCGCLRWHGVDAQCAQGPRQRHTCKQRRTLRRSVQV